MLPTSAGVEPATSWSPVGRRIQLSHTKNIRLSSAAVVADALSIKCHNVKIKIYQPTKSDASGCMAEASISISCVNIDPSIVGVDVFPPVDAIDWFSGV